MRDRFESRVLPRRLNSTASDEFVVVDTQNGNFMIEARRFDERLADDITVALNKVYAEGAKSK
jgi:hypothetical protein